MAAKKVGKPKPSPEPIGKGPDEQPPTEPGTDIHVATHKFLRKTAGIAKQLSEALDEYAKAFREPPKDC